MNKKALNIGWHLIGWLIFLVLPVVTLPAIIERYATNHCFLINYTVLSVPVICLFYFNYHFAIPRFYFKQKRLAYIAAIIGFILGILFVSIVYFKLFSMNCNEEEGTLRDLLRASLPRLVIITIVSFAMRLNARIKSIEVEKSKAELALLRAQINPHFLFNNLNVLGALIQQDQREAAAYLKRFAALYRYLLSNKENDAVLLSEELSFIADYIFLLKKRFGKAYDFQIQKESVDTNSVLIIPAAIQTLIENAVKHNRGATENPLKIDILIGEKTVMVTNEIRPKFAKQVLSTGTGLNNLTTRYDLLTRNSVKISQDNGQFLVILPLIKSLNGL